MNNQVYISGPLAVAVFMIKGVAFDADATNVSGTMMRALLVPTKGPVSYGVESLVRSVAAPDSVTGKKVEMYFSILQCSSHGADLDDLRRKMNIAEDILVGSGYKGDWLSCKDISALHSSILSNSRIGITRDPAPMQKVSGSLDNVADCLIRYSEEPLEAFSLIAYPGRKEALNVNVSVFATDDVRASVIAKSFNSRMMCRTFMTSRNYLAVRMKCLSQANNSSIARGHITMLPTSMTEFLTDHMPTQPYILGNGILNNDDGLYLGDIGKKRFTPAAASLFNLAVVGRPGSGKSNFLANLIQSVNMKGIHCFIIDLFDSDFRSLAKSIDAAVFTQNSPTEMLLNPFDIEGLSPDETQEFAKNYLLESLSLFTPQDGFVTRALADYYKTERPARNAENFIEYALDHFRKNNSYDERLEQSHFGALEQRLKKLNDSMTGVGTFQLAPLVKHNTMVELGNISSIETKTMMVSYLLHLLFLMKKKAYKAGKMSPTFIFIDEVSVLTDVAKSDLNIAAQGLKRFLLDLIKMGRKYGMYIVSANQELREFEAYFEQSHVKVLLNSMWHDQMGYEFLPYKNCVHRLKVGEAVLSMPEVQQAFVFQTPICTALQERWTDDRLLRYMNEQYPQYVHDRASTSDRQKPSCDVNDCRMASSGTIKAMAEEVISYVCNCLNNPDRAAAKEWRRGFNLRKFVKGIVRASTFSDENADSIIEEIGRQVMNTHNQVLITYIEDQLI